MCLFQGDTDERGEQDAEKQGSAHPFDQQDGGNQQADNAQQRRSRSDVAQTDERGVVVHNDSGILEPQKCDEQADTAPDGEFQRGWECVDNLLAQVAHGEQDEDNALNEHCRQGELPGVAHGEADRIGEERVQPHAGCKPERQLGIEGHQQGGEGRGQDGGRKQGTFVHACYAQYAWVDGQDIGHGQEGGDSGQNFCTDSGDAGVKTK